MLKNLLNYADNQSQNLDNFSVTGHLQKTFVIFSKFLALGVCLWGGGVGGGWGVWVHWLKKENF